MRIVIDLLIVISIFFAFAGVVGMLRMPDSFCRMQSSTNIATLGVLGVIIAGVDGKNRRPRNIYEGFGRELFLRELFCL